MPPRSPQRLEERVEESIDLLVVQLDEGSDQCLEAQISRAPSTVETAVFQHYPDLQLRTPRGRIELEEDSPGLCPVAEPSQLDRWRLGQQSQAYRSGGRLSELDPSPVPVQIAPHPPLLHLGLRRRTIKRPERPQGEFDLLYQYRAFVTVVRESVGDEPSQQFQLMKEAVRVGDVVDPLQTIREATNLLGRVLGQRVIVVKVLVEKEEADKLDQPFGVADARGVYGGRRRTDMRLPMAFDALNDLIHKRVHG